MKFNENKYLRCVDHLISLKFLIVLFNIILFTCLFGFLGYELWIKDIITCNLEEIPFISISAIIGALIGLILGLSSTWRVEMKIQEAYWRIDTINELKKQTAIETKNTPIAKTVVAIENKKD